MRAVSPAEYGAPRPGASPEALPRDCHSGERWATSRSKIGVVKDDAAGEARLRDLALLRRVRDRMDREFDRPLDMETLARDVHMSSGHLSRSFKAAYGESPYSYLMTRRIERAMAMFRRGDLNVTEVCFTVGFSELVGMSPSTYRRGAQESDVELPSCVMKAVTRPIRNREAAPPESD